MAVEVVDVGILQPVVPGNAGSMRGPATTTIRSSGTSSFALREGVDDAPE